MRIPIKSLKNGFEIPTLGFWTRKMWWTYSHEPKNDDEKDRVALKFAIESWLIAIDTAELYAWGYAEKLVGEVTQNYARSSLFISTKVIGSNASYTAIKNACKNSLRRLQTSYIDLYYIHWRDTQFDLQDQMKAMNELQDEGLIRAIGVCNFSTASLKLAQSFSKYPIVANQVHYNLLYREPEADGLLEYCQQNDVMLVAWRPLQYGKLSSSEFLETYKNIYQKTESQIALNWLISQPNVVTLFKSCNPTHISENLWSLGGGLQKKDMEEITEFFPYQVFVSDVVPLK